MINDCIFYEEQICIFNPVLMLEHALTKYYVSICFVNYVVMTHCLREMMRLKCKYSAPEN